MIIITNSKPPSRILVTLDTFVTLLTPFMHRLLKKKLSSQSKKTKQISVFTHIFRFLYSSIFLTCLLSLGTMILGWGFFVGVSNGYHDETAPSFVQESYCERHIDGEPM